MVVTQVYRRFTSLGNISVYDYYCCWRGCRCGHGGHLALKNIEDGGTTVLGIISQGGRVIISLPKFLGQGIDAAPGNWTQVNLPDIPHDVPSVVLASAGLQALLTDHRSLTTRVYITTKPAMTVDDAGRCHDCVRHEVFSTRIFSQMQRRDRTEITSWGAT